MKRALAYTGACIALVGCTSIREAPFLRGETIQGGIMVGRVAPGRTLTLDHKPLLVSPSGLFVFGFRHNHPPTAVLRTLLPDGTVESTQRLEVRARRYGVQLLFLPSHFVTLSPTALKHVQRDRLLKDQARKIIRHEEWFATPFAWPVDGIVTGRYGTRRILNGEPRKPHTGLDIAAPLGTPVRAPTRGVVTLAREGFFFEGNMVFLDHGHGLVSAFLHLSDILVTPGQQVPRGEILGTVGASGRATGPHLDWRLFWYETALDPALMVSISNACKPTTTPQASHECALLKKR